MRYRLRTLLIVLAVGPALVADFYFSAKWWMARQSKGQATARTEFVTLPSIRESAPKHPSSGGPLP